MSETTESTLIENLLKKIIAFDLEIHPVDDRLLAVGAAKSGKTNLRLEKSGDPINWLKDLGEMTNGAEYVLGHNIVAHDLKWIKNHDPGNAILKLKPIDTLILAPLAFPFHPYHRLWKGYKLTSQSKNDPLRDAEAALNFFVESWGKLKSSANLRLFQSLLQKDVRTSGTGQALEELTCFKSFDDEEIFATILREFSKFACCSQIASVWDSPKKVYAAWAFFVGWAPWSEGSSRPAPWVTYNFPEFLELIEELRGKNCKNCDFCLNYHDPVHNLNSHFNLPSFRNVAEEPPISQKDIVEALLEKQDVLVILSTGGGKSLCYQLPAVMLGRQKKQLSLIISPLQSLMKDQVDGLKARGIDRVGTVNGLQNIFERTGTLEEVALGGIDLLFVAPEQMRNKGFAEIIRQRDLGLVIVDEAHCISQWGHDFRPDYLFLAKFLKAVVPEKRPMPTIGCFTATAKQDVIAEIQKYFSQSLKKELELFLGSIERANLDFFVHLIDPAKKREHIAKLLEENLENGSGVVFAATRNEAENLSFFLEKRGFKADYFHGGRLAEDKRTVQDSFLDSSIRVICATNAFGMGVDKTDVRVVIHANVPGSLENYLQEAGRAGRDRNPSKCFLLFHSEDLEFQFQLTTDSRITAQDLIGIFNGVVKIAGKNRQGIGAEIVRTPNEILREGDEDLETIQADTDIVDTKIKMALAWLEKLDRLERTWNRTSIIEARPINTSFEASERTLNSLNLNPTTLAEWKRMLLLLHKAETGGLLSTDSLTSSFGRDAEHIIQILRELREAKLVSHDLHLSVNLKAGRGRNLSTSNCWQRFEKIESQFLRLLRDSGVYCEGSSFPLQIRTLVSKLKQNDSSVTQKDVRSILSELKKDETLGNRSMNYEQILLFPNVEFKCLIEKVELRKKIVGSTLRFLFSKIDKQKQGDQTVEFGAKELELALSRIVPDCSEKMLFEWVGRSLMLLHDIKAIEVRNGFSVFRPAITIKLTQKEPPRQEECKPLKAYSETKIFQIKVMELYAQLAQQDGRDAKKMVQDYFKLPRETFEDHYFKGKKGKLLIPTGEISLARIIGASIAHDGDTKEASGGLSENQKAVVTESMNSNILVLAGPGSGKTRTIVHRAAYLVRAKRVPWGSVLIIAFNRSTVVEIRKRLRHLLGNDSRRVFVQTYHGLALRIAEKSLADPFLRQSPAKFRQEMEDVVKQAVNTLKAISSEERDELTGGLIGRLRFILVDEYQDINEDQYKMISLLARKDEPGAEKKVHILAVGDDDQNIYQWRNSSNLFLKNFEEDYRPVKHLLNINYRAIPQLVNFSNQFITRVKDRIKSKDDMESSLGRDAILHATGALNIIKTKTIDNADAEVIKEIRRLQKAGVELKDIAVLAFKNDDIQRIFALGIEDKIEMRFLKTPQIPILRVREFWNFLDKVRGLPPEPCSKGEFYGRIQPLIQAKNSNQWTELIEIMVQNFLLEGHSYCPAELIEFFWDTAREHRQGEGGLKNGVTLSTIHGAKGLEFSAVILRPDGLEGTDEHRRLAYVAMTRAKQSLSIIVTKNTTALDSELLNLHEFKEAPHGPDSKNHHKMRFWEITPSEVKISHPATSREYRNISRVIAEMKVGDEGQLVIEKDSGKIFIDGQPVLVFSTAGKQKLASFNCFKPDSVKCYAILHHRKADADPKYQHLHNLDEWEYPLFSIRFIS